MYALDGRQYHGRQDSNSPPDGRQNVLSTMVKHTDKVHAGILLFALCWRILGLYEISGSGGTIKGFMRYRSVTRISLLLLLMLNILGFALNCLPVPGYRHKNKLKAIVAVNIIREWIEVFYNLYMILLGSDAVDKAIYQGRLFMNIWWSLLCMSFLRTRWVSSLVNGKPDINKDSYEEWVFRSSRGQYQGRR
ncbi:hypothetical protein EON64_04815 [archaeon]|nr:MAG: hypothetical protein EON64_04815 [archaeon]